MSKRYERKNGGKCDVRLTREEDLSLSRLAELNNTTRSAVIRKALRDFIKFNSADIEKEGGKG